MPQHAVILGLMITTAFLMRVRYLSGGPPRHHRTVRPEGDFLVKIKFIENHIIDESLVELIYAEFHEDSNKVHFKTLK